MEGVGGAALPAAPPAAAGPGAQRPDGQPLRFEVPGDPQGKGRPRAFAIKKGARAGQVAMHTPAKTRTYEGLIRSAAIDALVRRNYLALPVQGVYDTPTGPWWSKPTLLTITAYCPVPDSWPAWKRAEALDGRIRPTTKPDLDNVEKAIADALNGVVWQDDARVCSVRKRKLYGERPRIEIEVDLLPAQSAQDATRPPKEPTP